VRTAVVGHTEWIEFGHLERVPAAGDIVHATDAWEEPGGGGAVAAVQLARLAGSCTFLTALGDDERGRWSRRRLEGLGVRVEAAIRDEPTRRAVVFVDANGERTIATLGDRLAPVDADDLPWDELEEVLERIDPEVVLISERGLDDDEEDLERTLDLLADVPAGKLVVSEARIVSRDQVVALERAGVDAILVHGLARDPDFEAILAELVHGPEARR